jgi:hypothetical protein
VDDVVGAKAIDRPHVDLVAGSKDDVFDHARQGHDPGLREGVLQDLQSKMVVGMEMRYVDVSEVLAHGDDFGDHPVRIAEELGSIDQNCILFPVNQSGTAIEAKIAVKKNSKLERQFYLILFYEWVAADLVRRPPQPPPS